MSEPAVPPPISASPAPRDNLAWLRYGLASVAGGSWEVPAVFTMALIAATLLFGLLMIELRDKLALKGDLEIARQIQFGLLPFGPFRRGVDLQPGEFVAVGVAPSGGR